MIIQRQKTKHPQTTFWLSQLGCILFFIIATNSTYAAEARDTSFNTVIIESMTNSNADLLISISNNKIDIVLPEQSGIYSKNQAKYILNSFFDKVKPVSFHLLTKSMKSDGGYIIGKLHAENMHYRVCFLTKQNNTGLYIYQIRIEE